MAPPSILNTPVPEAVPAISSLPLVTSTVPLSVRVPTILCELELNSRSAPELTINEPDPETAPWMSTTVPFPLITVVVSLPSGSETAVLSATMVPSSTVAEVTSV